MASTYPSVPAGTKTLKLNTGNEIPVLGFGTWQSPAGQVEKAVEAALKAGYRHIDCAWMYGNEQEVAVGIRNSGVPRKDIFITTKIWGTYHRRVEEGLDDSLKKLGLDYVDLLLIHWPVPLVVRGEEKIPVDENGKRMLDQERKLSETWADMEKVYESGKAKAIGISNASQALLEELLPKVKVVPAANQIELHPYLPQHNLVNFCQAKGIVCEAYSPLGSTGSPLLQEDAVQAIAKSKGCDPAQVVISWGAQRGVAVLPKSVTPSRIESNATFVALDEDDMRKLNEIYQGSGKQKRFGMPAWGADFRFDDWKVPGAYTIKV